MHFGVKSAWSWGAIFLMCVCVLFTNVFTGHFCFFVHQGYGPAVFLLFFFFLFFFASVFLGFGIWGKLASLKKIGNDVSSSVWIGYRSLRSGGIL